MLGTLATLLSAAVVTAPPATAACPRADAVAAELDRLGATASLAVLGSHEVTVEGARMRVVLRGRDGSILGSREVAAPEACDERASVAAVFVAAWVGAWSTNPMPNLPSREPSTNAAIQTRRSPTVEIAGLAFGTHNGDAGTFGAGVFASYAISDALTVAALLETTGERETTVGPAMATYRTSRLGVGVGLRRRWGRLFGELGSFPELTLLAANGKPLVVPRKVTTWGAALEVRGRTGLVLGRFLPFLFVGASSALRAERLTLDDYPADATTLSRWNFSAGAGLAVLFDGTN